MSIPPALRTESHCRKLHALLRGLRSFDKFTDEIQMALCKAFTMERVEEGRIVLKNGHVGLNFYFIYSGSVFVNQEDELALLQDIRRTATVSVRERCELLVVEKDIFASVCPRIFDKELAEKHSFIKTLDLFSPTYWSPEAIHALSMNSQIQEYKINKIIVGNSLSEDWIYICMLGKCQIIRCLSLGKTPEGEQTRKESDVVLSEEILQLLASAGQSKSGEPLDRGDSKENLLSSLQLDYVQTNKKLYSDKNKDMEQQRTLVGHKDTATLTAYIQRQRDLGKGNLVYLNVGVLEAGQTFVRKDKKRIKYILGLALLRIKKAAFQDQASQQALDNARTLASKQVNPTEQSILESYKNKIAWEDFKAALVQDVKRKKMMRYQPLHRTNLNSEQIVLEQQRKNPTHSTVRQKSSKIISVLQNLHNEGEEIRRQSIARRSLTGRWVRSRPPPSVTFQRKKSLTLEDMKSGNTTDITIIRRQPSGADANKKISRRESEQSARPSGSNTNFFQQTIKMSS
ncbi:cyclic nucleotide-binding domain-containing protein 2-like [Plakobranchus ocellatus]|uniref:Cyclic nucleotide-binding domain-containing protein 2-like n=1 Tax=Plakobranchus ocellatus TaxID=259542 RepID=A0AAV4C0N5_9GAST|nr:cyclic nucleotide-binding domain-containing protein 2-like [Plakobranchus ocellatus]